MSERALTPKQTKFIDEYLIDLNASQAAIRAGYAPDSASVEGSRLLANVNVSGVLREKQEILAKKLNVTQEWVLQRFLDISNRCMQAEPVLNRKGQQILVENAEGDMVPAFMFDSTGANKATEMIGKHLGMFSDKTEINIDQRKQFNVVIEMNGGSIPSERTEIQAACEAVLSLPERSN